MYFKLVFFLLFVLVLSNPLWASNYQYECFSTNEDGYITIKIWDFKLNDRYSTNKAQMDALRVILFVGVPSSKECVTQPPTLTSQTEVTSFKKMEKKFFKKKGEWCRFTQVAISEEPLKDTSAYAYKSYLIRIAKKNLRNYLEENKIIKKLGDGF